MFTHWGDRHAFIEPFRTFFSDRERRPSSFRLPITLRERIQIFFVRAFSRWSDFAPSTLIQNPLGFSLERDMLATYLQHQGLLSSLSYTKRSDGYPLTHLFHARSAEFVGGFVNSSGSHSDADLAFARCIGEFLERRFSAEPSEKERERMHTASAEALLEGGADIMDAHRFHRYTKEQREAFPKLGYDPSKAILWVRGENLMRNQLAYIPAQAVFWRFGNRIIHREGAIREPNTSGCAGYMTPEGATLRALEELIQRDAFMCHWLVRVSPPRIVLDSIPDPEVQQILAQFKRYRFETHVLDMTTDIRVPSIAVVVIDRATVHPRLYVCAAAHMDPLRAIASALHEMNAVFGCFDNGKEVALPPDFKPFLTPFDREHRLRYLSGVELIAQAAWFFSGEEVLYEDMAGSFDAVSKSDKAQLRDVIAMLAARGDGYELYTYEVQAPILRALRYHVVRACVPKLMPLYLSEPHATIDSDRLREFAEFRGMSFSPQALLTGPALPHPFP